MKKFCLIVLTLLITSCSNDVDIVHPVINPGGLLSETQPLSDESKFVMNGIYNVIAGRELFGDSVVVMWNNRQLSVFSGNQGAYGVLEGGRIDSILYFEGTWRFPFTTSTGLLTFLVSADSGAGIITDPDTTDRLIILQGRFGSGNDIPSNEILLSFTRPLNFSPADDNFEILAHRGGGRNSDLLGASENSLALLSKAEGMGSEGVELDVRISTDNIPFLYHDDDINLRLTRKGPLWGEIEKYSWPQIRSSVTLVNGEKIPTLKEALDYILEHTLLKTVWLDIKSTRALNEAVILQQEALKTAEAMNRKLKIYIGIGTEEIYNAFLSTGNFQSIPSLCELGTDQVREMNAMVWAPRWTDGIQTDLVQQMIAENKEVFVWTIDDPAFIDTFIKDGEFSGMLSNYPAVIAYYHYMFGRPGK